MRYLDSIAFRIYAALISIGIVCCLSIGTITYKSVQLMNEGEVIAGKLLPEIGELVNRQGDFKELSGILNAVPLQTDKEYIRETRNSFLTQSQNLNKGLTEHGQKYSLDMTDLLSALNDYTKKGEDIFNLTEAFDQGKADELLKKEVLPLFSKIDKIFEDYEKKIDEEKEITVSNFEKLTKTIIMVVVLSFLFLVLATVFFSLLTRKTLVSPLNQIIKSIISLSKGNMEIELDLPHAKGEIKELRDAIFDLKKEASIAFLSKFSLNSIETPVAVLNTEGNIMIQNPALKDYLKACFGVTVLFEESRIHEFQLYKIFKNSKLININALDHTELYAIEYNGHTIDIKATPILVDDDQLLGVFVEFYDRTEEKKAEKELQNIIGNVVRGDFTKTMEIENKRGFMKEVSESVNSLIQQLSSVLESFSRIFSNIAQGNLNVEVTENFEGVFDTIKNDANKTVDILKGIVKDIQKSTKIINNNLQNLRSSSGDLLQRSETQSTNLQETAAAIEELTSTIKLNSDYSQTASHIATETKFLAAESEGIVNEAIEEMQSIMKTSKRIHKIISVIEEISFQTNLLSLNASIEAARAGDAGVGFAVVASEVRKLAQDSAKASEEIKSIITKSTEQITKGVGLINKTGMVLGEIVEHSTSVDDRVGEISHTTMEQSTGLDQINTAVSQLDHITQMNFNQVQENQKTVEQLERLAGKLNEKTSFFRI